MDKAANINESFTVPCVYPVPVRDIPLQIQVPGSKSITNRALLLATLGNGTSTLRGALFSDDSRVFLSCIQRLGFPTKVGEEHREIQVTGMNGRVPVSEADIFRQCRYRSQISDRLPGNFSWYLSYGCL